MILRLYFDYPLEQGLRRRFVVLAPRSREYFDYPLEQGLRHMRPQVLRPEGKYFDYPLEQGLRLGVEMKCLVSFCILIIH